MRLDRAVMPAIGALLRLPLILPAAIVAALLSAVAIDDASAHGFGLNRSISGLRFGNSMRPQGMFSGRRQGMSQDRVLRPGSSSKFTKTGKHKATSAHGKHARQDAHGRQGKHASRRVVADRDGSHRSELAPEHRKKHRIGTRSGAIGAIAAVPAGAASEVVPPSNAVRSGGLPPTSSASTPPGGSRRIDVPAAGERRYVRNEVVVEVASGAPAQVLNVLARRHRLTRLESLDFRLTGSTLMRWRIDGGRSVTGVLRQLAGERLVLSAQPNYLASLQEQTRAVARVGSGVLEQYALEKLRLPEAHRLATGERILIAVIDSGIDSTHPELVGMIADSFDAIGSGDTVHAHGTAVAGAIVAGARLKGAAPAARILAVRAFGAQRESQQGTTFSILKGLDWATAREARIINMSFAGPRDPAMLRALATARGRGIILVAAAGNSGPASRPLYPAADASTIAVTATDENDDLYHAANRGPHIAVAAPGVDVLLPAPGGEYRMTSGTSFAAAEVSGAIALMLERKRDLDPASVRRILMETARDLGPSGPDHQFGAGLVDAYQAILAVTPAPAAAARLHLETEE
jgi:subtilisin family serine protease